MQRFYQASTLYPVLCCYDSQVCKDFFCVSIKDLNWIESYAPNLCEVQMYGYQYEGERLRFAML